jgi:hypothetical protein
MIIKLQMLFLFFDLQNIEKNIYNATLIMIVKLKGNWILSQLSC